MMKKPLHVRKYHLNITRHNLDINKKPQYMPMCTASYRMSAHAVHMGKNAPGGRTNGQTCAMRP